MLFKKEALVKRSMQIQYNPDHTKRQITFQEQEELMENSSKIIRLNRRIRKTVKFL